MQRSYITSVENWLDKFNWKSNGPAILRLGILVPRLTIYLSDAYGNRTDFFY